METDITERIQSTVSQYKSIWLKPDYEGARCQRIPATALLGNGDVGAFSRSDYGKISFSFSKSNFWEYGGSPLNIGTLSVEVTEGRKSGFYECQDIYAAKVITETGAIRGESFIVPEKNFFVIKLSSEKDVSVRLTLEAHKSEGRKCSSALNDDKISVIKQTKFSGKNTLSAVISCEVIGAESKNLICSDGCVSTDFRLLEGSEVFIVSAVCSGKSGAADPYNRAMFKLDKIKTVYDVDSLEAFHNTHWKDYWSKSFVDADTSDNEIASIMKYYYGAQYLLGSGICENACAPGLYGIWHSSDESPWKSDYHLNYNFVSAFYGCASSNRPRQLLPACVAISDYIEKGKQNAADINQWRQFESSFIDRLIAEGRLSEESGIKNTVLYPVGITPYGTSDAKYWNETMDAAYSAYPMIDYYRHTMDESFRRQILYPYLVLVLGILDAWLVEEDGKFTLYAGYNEGSWSKNPAVELSAYKMCLREAIDAARFNGIDAEMADKWQNYLDSMSRQPVGIAFGREVLSLAETEFEDGEFSEPEDCLPEDGNAIVLDCVIPGGIIDIFSDKEDIAIAENTIEVFDLQNAWENCNNFPRLFSYAVDTGYDINKITKAFSEVIDGSIRSNLTIDDEVHGFEKAGAVRTVNDMLLQTGRGIAKLFPNWRMELNASFYNLRASGAFIFSAEYDKDKGITEAYVTSEAGGILRIACEKNMNITDPEGNSVETAEKSLPDRPDVRYYEFVTEASKTYKLI